MLEAHSPLWHYLWVAPNLLLLVLAFFLWRRKLNRDFPVFFIFALLEAVEQLTLYAADVIPSVSPEAWWRVFWVGVLIEGVLKFALVGEIFARVFSAYESVASLGKILIRSAGIVLMLAAAVAAGLAPKDSHFGIVFGAHRLEQTIYFVESGLIVFIFGLASYFRLSFGRRLFGITLGLGISACVHLATWALIANGGLSDETRHHLDFLNMATYHACVLLWFYFLLLPGKVANKSAVPMPEHNLDIWNRELERLLRT